MLVLTRRTNEEIVIEGGITIKVLGIEGNKVRLGVDAPEGVRVDRKEVHDRRAQFAAEERWSEQQVRLTDYQLLGRPRLQPRTI